MNQNWLIFIFNLTFWISGEAFEGLNWSYTALINFLFSLLIEKPHFHKV